MLFVLYVLYLIRMYFVWYVCTLSYPYAFCFLRMYFVARACVVPCPSGPAHLLMTCRLMICTVYTRRAYIICIAMVKHIVLKCVAFDAL